MTPHLGLYLAGRCISGHQAKQVLAFLGTWPGEEMGSGMGKVSGVGVAGLQVLVGLQRVTG